MKLPKFSRPSKPSVLKNYRVTDYSKLFSQRLNILSFMIGIFFLILWVTLFTIQITRNESYRYKLEQFTQSYQYMASPRGEMFDRNGEILVTNTERLAIVYFPPVDITIKKEWELAYRIADDFEIDVSTTNARDLKDLFILLYPDEAEDKITESEWESYSDGKLYDSDIYRLKLERITEAELTRFDERTIEAFVVRTAMKQTPYLSLKVIKDNATVEEIAYLIEHNNLYPGFDVNIYFDRSYPQGTILKGLVGNVTSSKQGLASENLLYYLALGYSRNSSVGRSGLELQYESLLKGNSTAYNIDYNDDGLALFSQAIEGSKGQNLTLSVDIGLQRKLEEILTEILSTEAGTRYRKYMEKIYVVAMVPSTGDVLGLAGMLKASDGTIINDPVAAYTDSYAAGSSVKGAVVYMALAEGLFKPNERIKDEPIKIADTPIKRSWKDLGLVNDQTALSMSSNVYMFHVAMRLGGAEYVNNGPLNIDPSAFDIIRSYFSKFGLGTKTGIDVPNETLGYMGFSTLGGHLLDFSIGQYDTYTTIQLAQYISTIANDGVRVKPRLLLNSKLTDSNVISYQNPVSIISTLDDLKSLDRVQSGFRLCVTDGLCKALNNLPVSVAAKTGTAESFMSDANGNTFDAPNSVLVSYAPYEKPEIAIACGIPHAWNDESQANLCLRISNELYAYYFQN